MSKQESLILKGVAICLMVFLHLFNHKEPMMQPNLFVGDKSLVQWLAAAANPVSIYLILSGYGMYFIYKQGIGDKHRWSRIINLYLHHWVILSVFAVIGFVRFGGGQYTDIEQIILNYSAWNTSWYAEGWFLFPYVLLAMLSPYLFRITDRLSVVWTLITAMAVGLVSSYIISRFATRYLYSNMIIYNPLLVIHIAPSFLVGAMLCKSNKWKLRAKQVADHLTPYGAWGILLLLIIMRCVINTSAWGLIYTSLFVVFFLVAPRWKWVDKTLAYLGKHSMNMWLIHAWFCYYVFHDETYALKYPLLIFVVVLVVSLLCSLLINMVCQPLERKFIDRK